LSRGLARASEIRQRELLGREHRSVRVELRLTPFEVARLDAIAQGRSLSRSAALREAIAWLVAKDAHWAERARQARVAALGLAADDWQPVSDALAAGRSAAGPTASVGDGRTDGAAGSVQRSGGTGRTDGPAAVG
jgi:predicted transcriptional regulator